MPRHTDSDETPTEGPDRRALLRRGGAAIVAGAVGLAVGETIGAPAADAAVGGPVVMGAANDAQTSGTGLTGASMNVPTLLLANTANAGVAPLKLVEDTVPSDFRSAPLTSGDLGNFGGDLYYTAGGTGGPFVGFVYTDWVASQLIPIKPQRVLDTRTTLGRANIISPAGKLDSSGRLIGGKTIEINLSSLVFASMGVYCNITAVTPLGGSFMSLWPSGPRPATSSVNFPAKSIVANFAVTGTSATDTVLIFSGATSHVLLDITAFAVGGPGQINPVFLPSVRTNASNQPLGVRAGRTPPAWYKGRSVR